MTESSVRNEAERMSNVDPPQANFGAWYRALLNTVDAKIQAAIEPLTFTRTITLWYVFQGQAGALATTDFIEAIIDFPLVITGITVLTRDSLAAGSTVLDIGICDITTYPTFTSIVAAAPPTITAPVYQDLLLTGWTTLLPGGAILQITPTANTALAMRLSIGIRCKPLGQLSR